MRYFFSVTNGEFYADRDGTKFADHDEARLAAAEYAGELIRDHPETVWDHDELQVEVADGRGLILFTVTVQASDAPALRSATD